MIVDTNGLSAWWLNEPSFIGTSNMRIACASRFPRWRIPLWHSEIKVSGANDDMA